MKWFVVAVCLLLTSADCLTQDGRPSGPENPTVDVDQECVALAPQGKCEFYDCFFQRYRCYNFLLADAKTICMKLKDRKARLTDPGKKWVEDTEVCLQRRLLQNYTADTPIDCAAFRQYGFDLHKQCSIENGVCNIFWDNKFTLVGVLDVHNLSHIRHTMSVLGNCLHSRIATWFGRLVRIRQAFSGSGK